MPSTSSDVAGRSEDPLFRRALTEFLYQVADDELTIGHRSSEWLGLGPDLEEDIAFSSISQDEVGHAAFYYGLLGDLGEGDPDELAFARLPGQRKNAILAERENGDWAHAIARGYFYDAFEQVRLRALARSSHEPLRLGANKIVREERYHLLHMETWFVRLAGSGGEARERIERAIASIWPELGDLFSVGSVDSDLVASGVLPVGADTLYAQWEALVGAGFRRGGLPWPGTPRLVRNGRLGEHTADLPGLLNTLGEVREAVPDARW